MFKAPVRGDTSRGKLYYGHKPRRRFIKIGHKPGEGCSFGFKENVIQTIPDILYQLYYFYLVSSNYTLYKQVECL